MDTKKWKGRAKTHNGERPNTRYGEELGEQGLHSGMTAGRVASAQYFFTSYRMIIEQMQRALYY